MSFLAKLKFLGNSRTSGSGNDEGYNVLEFSIDFNVATDRRGKRTEELRGGQINLLIESNKNAEFLQWASDPNENRDGEIIFYKSDVEAPARKVFFGLGDCIQYSEEFIANNEIPMLTRITISAFVVKVDDCEVKIWEEAKNL